MFISSLFIRNPNPFSLASMYYSYLTIKAYRESSSIRIDLDLNPLNVFIRLLEGPQQLRCDYMVPESINYVINDTDLILDPNRYLELINSV